MLKNKILESLKCLEGDKSAIQEFIEKYMIDPDGLIVSYLNKNTLNVWTEAELGKYDILPIYNKQRGDPAGQLAYEDTLMATGEYASAMLAEFEVTGNHKAIASASFHVFAILRVLHEGEKYEKGFLPKPHGGMNKAQYSHEISPDQYIKAFIALREYQRYASPSLNKTIDGYLVAIADYFLNRNFCHPYRERTLVKPETHPHALSIIVPSLFVAYKISGNKKYIDALNTNFESVLESLANGNITLNFNMCSLLVEGFHYALSEGFDKPVLKTIIKLLWEKNLKLITPENWGYENENNRSITSRVLRMSSIAPIVDLYFPEVNTWEKGLAIMMAIKEPLNILYVNKASESMPETSNFLLESICETSLSSWLLAYWRFNLFYK